MTRDTLLDLAARVEAAQGADRVLDWQIYAASKDIPWGAMEAAWIRDNGTAAVPYGLPKFTVSLDAAASLVPAGLAWTVLAMQPNDGNASAAVGRRTSVAATPALALTAAALHARAEEARDGE